MLQVNKIRGGEALHEKVRYFIEQLHRTGQYYLAHEELALPAHWGGQLAAELGLAGHTPTTETLTTLLLGEHPQTEAMLLPMTAQGHQPGLEITCSMPKQFSLCWAAAPADTKTQMEAMLRRATERLVATIERDVPLVRRGRTKAGERILETAAGIVVGFFPHLTSRQTRENLEQGRPPDPALHVHVLVANLTKAHDGTWHAVDSYSLQCRQRELDAVWQGYVVEEMRTAGMAVVSQAEVEMEQAQAIYERHVDDLTRIGLQAEPFTTFAADVRQRTGKALVERSRLRQFHLRGFVDPRLIAAFSSRKRQVEANVQTALIRLQRMTVAELAAIGEHEAAKWTQVELDRLPRRSIATIIRRAWAENRLKKLPVPRETLQQWQERLATEFMITEATVAALFAPQPTPTVAVTRAEVWRDALGQLPHSNAYVDWDELRALVCASALRLGYTGMDRLRAELIAAEAGTIAAIAVHPELVVGRIGRTDKITTTTWLATERRILDAVRTLRDAPLAAPTLGLSVTDAALPVLADVHLASGTPAELTAEQVGLLETVLSRRVSAVQGEAGSGKGIIAQVVSRAWHLTAPEGTVYALAVAGARAVRFRDEVAADTGATFERFALDVAAGRMTLSSGDCVIVDEAAMVDSARFGTVMDAISASGATPGLLLIGDPAQMRGIGASGLFQEVEAITGRLNAIREVKRTDDVEFIAAQKAVRASEIHTALAYHVKEGHLRWVDTAEEARDAAVTEWATHYRPERHGTKDHPVIAADRTNVEIDALAMSCQNVRLERGELDPQNFVEVRHENKAKGYVLEERIFAGAARVTTDALGRERRHEVPGDLVRVTSTLWTRDGNGQRHQLRNGQEAEVVGIRRAADGQAQALQLRLLTAKDDAAPVVVSLERATDWDKLRVGYAKYTMGDQGSSRHHQTYLTGRLTSRASFYVGDSRGTAPGPIIVDRQSLGLEPEVDEATCLKALEQMLEHEEGQQAALTISPEYLEARRVEVAAIAERQAMLDAERARLVTAREAEIEEERRTQERVAAEHAAERSASLVRC